MKVVNRRLWVVSKIVLALSVWLFASCAIVEAQQTARVPVIGYLTTTKLRNVGIEPFRRGLQALGYIEGKNIRVEYRYFETKRELIPPLVAELVQMNVEVLVASVPQLFVPPGRLRKRFR